MTDLTELQELLDKYGEKLRGRGRKLSEKYGHDSGSISKELRGLKPLQPITIVMIIEELRLSDAEINEFLDSMEYKVRADFEDFVFPEEPEVFENIFSIVADIRDRIKKIDQQPQEQTDKNKDDVTSHCLEPPEGAVHPHSPCYIERPVDQQVLAAIKKTGVTLTIEGPSFVGKSSLLMRLASVAQNELSKKVVILRLGDILGASQMENNVSFYRRFCYSLNNKLNIRENTAFYWDVPLTDPERCTAYINDYILSKIDVSIQSLVIALEGMELLFETEICDQFSRMLRGWTDERAFSGASIWRKVDLVLVTSTEPYLFIENFHGSPFNVGLRHHLSDFEREHLFELNERHNSPLEEGEIDDLMNCIGGHPYLVRQTFYWLSKGATLKKILERAKNDHNGPFDSHLRGLMKKIKRGFDQNIETELCKAFDDQLTDELMFQRLRGAGLVKREAGCIQPRCKLYEEYFKERLKGNG